MSFSWRRGNESYDGQVTSEALTSFIRLGLNQDSFGTYYCYVNNTVGLGIPCEIDIQGIGVLKNISDTNVIVIGAVIAAIVVALLILVFIIAVCRRRHGMVEKCPNGINGHDASSVVKDSSELSSGGKDVAAPQHKWPLRPGENEYCLLIG